VKRIKSFHYKNSSWRIHAIPSLKTNQVNGMSFTKYKPFASIFEIGFFTFGRTGLIVERNQILTLLSFCEKHNMPN
jgi:hypothetical protein